MQVLCIQNWWSSRSRRSKSIPWSSGMLPVHEPAHRVVLADYTSSASTVSPALGKVDRTTGTFGGPPSGSAGQPGAGRAARREAARSGVAGCTQRAGRWRCRGRARGGQHRARSRRDGLGSTRLRAGKSSVGVRDTGRQVATTPSSNTRTGARRGLIASAARSAQKENGTA